MTQVLPAMPDMPIIPDTTTVPDMVVAEDHLLAGSKGAAGAMVGLVVSFMCVAAAIASSTLIGILVGLVLLGLWRLTVAVL